MGQHFIKLAAMAIAAGSLLAGCADSHTNWSKQREYLGVEVMYDMGYDTGDFDVKDAQDGQEPAEFMTYYYYMKDGERVRHDKAVWWYAEGVRKAETVYVHGKHQGGKIWYKGGGIREVATITDAGRERVYYDRTGKPFASHKWDKLSKKAVYKLRDKVIADHDEFMYEVGKVCYGRTRFMPH